MSPETLSLTVQNPSPVKPLVLLILDGWGLREDSKENTPDNPIQTESLPHYRKLIETCPWIPLSASGLAVGLPAGQVGSSEVGHMTLGAGRVIAQDLVRINNAIEDKSFFENSVLREAFSRSKASDSTVHLVGLVSDGGVHSHVNHLLALLEMAKSMDIQKLNVHAILDGRDVLPKTAEASLEIVEKKLLALDYPQIQTVTGRFFAMDRDRRWNRTQQAYDNLVSASGIRHMLSLKAVQYNYKVDVSDEFIPPSVCDLTYGGFNENDVVICFNYRADRIRQLMAALIQPEFVAFERKTVHPNLYVVGLTSYDESWSLPAAFPKEPVENTLGEIVSKAGLRQFRCAESEKYAHVTYFFNGGLEQPFKGEDRKLIPSPKVATYDEQPEMSLPLVVEALKEALESRQYHLLVVNIANADMIGHTGSLSAAKKAVKAIDDALGQIISVVQSVDGTLLITSDHGNIETMHDPEGKPNTAHQPSPVPLILMESNHTHRFLLESGELSQVAPLVLSLLGFPIAAEMSPYNLIGQGLPQNSKP